MVRYGSRDERQLKTERSNFAPGSIEPFTALVVNGCSYPNFPPLTALVVGLVLTQMRVEKYIGSRGTEPCMRAYPRIPVAAQLGIYWLCGLFQSVPSDFFGGLVA